MFNRVFVLVVIGGILVVLAIFLVIVLVLGDNEDQGNVTAPAGHPVPSLVHG